MQMLLESSIFYTQQVTDRTSWWRGNAVGLHQLVVTMEDLAGPHAVPNRILRVGARRQPFARLLLR